MVLLASALLVGCSPSRGTADSDDPAGDSVLSASDRECLTERSFMERLDFATRARAAEILLRPDDWARQLSPFEMAARQGTAEAPSLDAFLAFLGSAARTWSAAEEAYWRDLADRLSAGMAGLNVTVADVFLVKTSGEEEFGMAYHRNRGIMLPEARVAISGEDARSDFFLLAHEAFHYLGSRNPATRDSLFALLGFEQIDLAGLPPELDARRLSNPDGHTYRHALAVQHEGRTIHVVPAIQSALPLEGIIGLPGGGPPALLDQIEVVLVPVDMTTGTVRRGDTGDLRTYALDETDWRSRTQRNTSFSIHPEEIMADNFALLMEWRRTGSMPGETPGGFPVDDADLLRSIQELLTRGCG